MAGRADIEMDPMGSADPDVSGPSGSADAVGTSPDVDEYGNEPIPITGVERGDVQTPTKHSPFFGATMNFVNSIVGAGIIGLPYALYHSGFILGVFLLIFVAFMIDYGVRGLVASGVAVNKNNYEAVMEHCFNKIGYYAATICMAFFAFGAMVAYHVVIGDTIPPIIEEIDESSVLTNRGLVVFIYSLVFMLPLSLLKNMASLEWTSSLSIFSVCVIVLIVVIEVPESVEEHGAVENSNAYTFAKPTWFAGVGTMSFAFVCHHSSFIVYNSLKDNSVKNWTRVTHCSMLISLTLCLVLAITGYLDFQSETKGDILNNYSFENTAVNIARALLAMTMVFTYPMENFVTRHCIIKILTRREIINNANYNMWHYGLTVFLWVIALSIGASVDDLGIVLELVGVVCGVMLGFIFPGLVILRVKTLSNLKNECLDSWFNARGEPSAVVKWKKRMVKTFELIFPIFMVFFGCVVFIAGIYTIVIEN